MFDEVLGWELERAAAVVKKAGFGLRVIPTLAPKAEPVGKPRVVRVREAVGGEVELVVVYYREPPLAPENR
ncbi:MAG: hypothetical protein AB1507_03010 [Bacillota bacterium]|nr:hypothetical protein [Thermoanaerobacteraceae bacterium]